MSSSFDLMTWTIEPNDKTDIQDPLQLLPSLLTHMTEKTRSHVTDIDLLFLSCGMFPDTGGAAREHPAIRAVKSTAAIAPSQSPKLKPYQ